VFIPPDRCNLTALETVLESSALLSRSLGTYGTVDILMIDTHWLSNVCGCLALRQSLHGLCTDSNRGAGEDVFADHGIDLVFLWHSTLSCTDIHPVPSASSSISPVCPGSALSC